MIISLILNEGPYGSEKTFNALRLAMALQKKQLQDHDNQDPPVEVRLFLMADAVTCALTNQTTPQGYYNTERMLRAIIQRGGLIRLCGSYSEARGIAHLTLVEGADISTMEELSRWVIESDKVLVF